MCTLISKFTYIQKILIVIKSWIAHCFKRPIIDDGKQRSVGMRKLPVAVKEGI